ncbi:isochorismate synthase MenF [Gordonia sp. (in: high G+C Gram-positive bacteria)]|uniref:isochorismate synthase n=1 Tax=Gordonia sp. (in: high G+C Gram-positive bacteria) TaxID=84139 RepID=UPI00169B8DD0|nr:isochorismate synthase [Gordonia sp. (in: high G+C Gram-positive bacteria)]NLG46957.1 isochorismate synthase [Gordonia sp. (in: high G+C Gram-positive bacteria)]
MSSGLSFVLSNTELNARGFGVRAAYASVHDAAAALRTGRAEFVGGAIGFDTSGITSLIAPERVDFAPVDDNVHTEPDPVVETLSVTPDAVHRARVVAAIEAIDAGRVQKVVVARSLEAELSEPVGAEAMVQRFTATAGDSTVFAADLRAAPGYDGKWLIGASPELLLRKRGATVHCVPYAGSAPRFDADGRLVPDASEQLQRSDKDLREHAYVVDYLRELLAPLCTEIDVPDRPTTISTRHVWHLATPITGRLADPSMTSLDLAALLSPTPAVCGTPTRAAAELIGEIEGDRDFYAGAVGWCDAAGDGEWVVSIRCLELDPRASDTDRARIRAWAGGGIVAGSDPDAEVAETTAKFQTVLTALGAAKPTARPTPR